MSASKPPRFAEALLNWLPNANTTRPDPATAVRAKGV